jgi:hypothetical protein
MENKDMLIFSESDINNVIDSVSENVTTFIEDLKNDVITSEEAIVEYARLISRNEPEYFERPAKELILEWALKYVDTARHYGKKL